MTTLAERVCDHCGAVAKGLGNDAGWLTVTRLGLVPAGVQLVPAEADFCSAECVGAFYGGTPGGKQTGVRKTKIGKPK